MSSIGACARLASIHIYPLKAARAVDLGQALVEPWGLAGDRRRRRFGQMLVFGQNMIPEAPGAIRVGDPVEVDTRR